MIDKRTKEGKALAAAVQTQSVRDLAAQAALARFTFSNNNNTTTKDEASLGPNALSGNYSHSPKLELKVYH